MLAQLVQDSGLLRVLRVEVVADGLAARCHEMVLGGVDRDSIEPSVERAIAAERRRRTIRLQKRFLRNVKGFGRVTNVSHDELDDLVLVLDDQQIERRSVALLHASDQREVRGSATGRVSVGLLCQTLLGRPHAAPKVRSAPRRLELRDAAHGRGMILAQIGSRDRGQNVNRVAQSRRARASSARSRRHSSGRT